MPDAPTSPGISTADGALLDCVRRCIDTLAGVTVHAGVLDDATIQRAQDARTDVLRRLERRELFVCIVGEKKSGKSTFLNAILGERILGAANREYTGAVTTVRRAERYNCTAKWVDGTSEDFSVQVPDRAAEFQAAVDAIDTRRAELAASKAERVEAIRASDAELSKLKAEISSLRATQIAALSTFISARADVDAANATALAAYEMARAAVPELYQGPASKLSRIQKLIRWLFYPLFGRALARLKSTEAVKNQISVKAFEVTINSEPFKKLKAVREDRAGKKDEAKGVEARIQTLQLELVEFDAQIAQEKLRLKDARAALERHAAERKASFIDTVARMTDMERDAGKVAEMALEFPAKYLPDGVVFIDTPGVNTDAAENRARAWSAIQRDADGCILLSDLQQAVSQSTKDFIDEIKKEVPHIVLVLTKVDKVFFNAEGIGDVPAEVQVEEARRKGVLEFAKKVKRAPEDLLAVALAAKPVLDRPDDATARALFEGEIHKIFQLLKRERTLMLGMRSATIVKSCIAGIAGARAKAEDAFRERIERLDAQRIPNPDAFCRTQMARIEPAIQNAAKDVIFSSRSFAYRGIESLFRLFQQRIEGTAAIAELEAVEEDIQRTFNDMIADVVLESRGWARKELGTAATKLEDELLEEIRTCYRIVENLAHVSRTAVKKSGGWVSFEAPSITPYEAPQKSFFTGIVKRLGAWLKGMGEYHTEAIGTVRSYLDLAEADIQDKLGAQKDAMADALRRALHESIREAVATFQSWIAAVIEDERKAIESERAKLQALVELGENLKANGAALDEAMRAAERDSIGISR